MGQNAFFNILNVLFRADVGTIFALSWLITWFGHDIDSFEIVVRLFDVFLSHNPTMPVYLAVVVSPQLSVVDLV